MATWDESTNDSFENLRRETGASVSAVQSLRIQIANDADLHPANYEGVVPFAPLGNRGTGIKYVKRDGKIVGLYVAG